MPVTQEMLDEVALSAAEYEMIVDRLDREPNPLELGMFGSLWSEHCGYKHSKALLRRFPNTGHRVMVKPGEENAGVVDIGGGLAVTMKIESHNHPSAIEPYQGAATGVGGIVRDIFTMGARPIALLNSLRFGAPDQPQNRRLLQGVVAGIGGYGNCLGIPNVGGEVFFDDAYGENPLVNAMCVGLLSHGDLVSSTAKGLGNSIMLVGAETGRDGIHGASGLASRSFEETKELRSAVQVGNPFLEKCLIEACLEAAALEEVVAMQDLGAAGLTSAAIESAAKGGLGLKIDVAKVPRRESGMTPYEVMLSESQERMLVIVERGREARVRAIFDRWGLTSTIIGEITDDGRARIYDGNDLVCDASITDLAAAPEYTPPSAEPHWLAALQQADLSLLPAPGIPMNDVLLRLLQSPNVASKRPVFRQYDHQVIDNTVIPPGADAALLRVKGTRKGLAFTTDGNGRFCHLDPYAGGAIAVMEAARNLACVGAEVVAVTDGLNFGNPEKPEVYYQMEQLHRRHGRRLQRPRRPRHQRQRQPLQRDARRADLSHSHRRRTGPDRGDRPTLLAGVQGRRRPRLRHRRRPRWPRQPRGLRVPRRGARARRGTPDYRPLPRNARAAPLPRCDSRGETPLGPRLLARRAGRRRRRLL